jgi:hypothetical protein
MLVARVLGVLCLLCSLYYLRFFVLRHEPATVAQLVALLCAAALLLLQQQPERPRSRWFNGWWPSAWQGWLAGGVAIAVALAVFRVMDADSHSASDTLNRVVPTYSLLAALLIKLRYERNEHVAP